MIHSQDSTTGLPGSWYPLCRAQDLKKGAVIEVQLFGKKIAVFRTEKNVVGALDARCCHIGADLTRGWVEGESLTCPLHRWKYNVDGECTNIPCQKKIPPRIKQSAYHCGEHFGLVYAYLGQKPEFPLPQFPGVEHSIYSAPGIIDVDVPYEKVAANVFDFQRMETYHRQQVINTQKISSLSTFHFGVKYRALIEPRMMYDKLLHGIGNQDISASVDCWGGNLLLFSYIGSSFKMVISLLPISENRTRVFVSTTLPHIDHVMTVPFKWLAVQILNRFAIVYVRRDLSSLIGIDFKFINVLAGVDSTMVKWQRYWSRLPRESVGARAVKKPKPTYLIKSISRDKNDEVALLEEGI